MKLFGGGFYVCGLFTLWLLSGVIVLGAFVGYPDNITATEKHAANMLIDTNYYLLF